MNGFYKKFLGLFFFLALVVLFLPLQGCPDPVNDQLTEGSVFEVELQVLGDGSLYALEIELADADADGDEDDDEDEDEDEQEGEHEDGDDDDDENEDVDKGFSVQVDSVATDCSSFTVFGTLAVVLDEGDDDDDEEGEGRDVEEEDGDDDEDDLSICDLSAGMWIEVEGFYGTDGFFYAEEIEETDEEETEMVGVIENLTSSTFTIFGVMITYDSNTEIDLDDDDDNDDDDNDDNDDDDECEQEGENEGDNEGCCRMRTRTIDIAACGCGTPPWGCFSF